MDADLQLPRLEPGWFYLIFDEVMTGILCTTDGSRYLGSGEYYVTFSSMAEAEGYANRKVAEMPHIECSLRDFEGGFIKLIQNLDFLTSLKRK